MDTLGRLVRLLLLLSLCVLGGGSAAHAAARPQQAEIGALQATGLCDGSGGVYLYEHDEFQGGCIRLTGNVSDLTSLSFNNLISSVRVVGSWTATLYVDQDYGGASTTLISDDPDLRGNLVGNDRASSVRVRAGIDDPIPPEHRCDGREGVYLYEDTDFRGDCVRITRDTADLSDLLFNNTASSVRIEGDWTVTLYVDQYYEGEMTTLSDEDPDLSNNPIGENRASAARVQRGPALPELNRCDGRDGVYLYEHPDYGGRCLKVTDTVDDLRTLSFDDSISSVGFVGSWSVTLYRDLALTGGQSTFIQADPVLSDDLIGDNQATSLRVVRGGAPPAANRCDGGEGVYLYEHPDFLGRCIKLTADTMDLRPLAFDDTASSVRLIGRWNVTLARDLSGFGVTAVLSREDANLADDAIGDNQVTSVLVRR